MFVAVGVQNTFNSADHAISNNTLEQWLQIMQIVQLALGLANQKMRLPDWAATTLYMLIIGVAVALSLTALSGELSKYVHSIYLKLEPAIKRVTKRLGWGAGDGSEDGSSNSSASQARAKRARKNETAELLNLARSYEKAKKEEKSKVALEAIATETG